MTTYAWRPDEASAWILIMPDVLLPDFEGPGQGVRVPTGSAHFAGWTDDERAAKGIVEVAEAERPDDLLYAVGDQVLEDVEGVPTLVWQAVPRSPEEVRSRLYAYARDARWRCEQGGLMFDGYALPTNDSGQAYIKGAAQAAAMAPELSKQWQVGNDPIEFVTFSNAQLLALGWALDSLVQGAFDVLADLAPQIADGTITTTAQIDAAFAEINRTFTSEPTE